MAMYLWKQNHYAQPTVIWNGMEYKMGTTNVYANITQAYRPVLFSDITPPAVTDVWSKLKRC
jgi:hypothetical protein